SSLSRVDPATPTQSEPIGLPGGAASYESPTGAVRIGTAEELTAIAESAEPVHTADPHGTMVVEVRRRGDRRSRRAAHGRRRWGSGAHRRPQAAPVDLAEALSERDRCRAHTPPHPTGTRRWSDP